MSTNAAIGLTMPDGTIKAVYLQGRNDQGEKLFFALDIQESSLYDVSELQNAGLTVWLQEVTSRGNLGAAKLCQESVDLSWDIPAYMTLCNYDSTWSDTRIGLDSENHKFVLLAAPSA